MTDLLAAARDALAGERAWLVGGAVRDRLLGTGADVGRLDLDVVIDGDVRGAARRVAGLTGGAPFELSGQHGAWRVSGARDAWHVDVIELQGGDLLADLALRDLTVNAMAEPLAGGELVDPHGGVADLRARRLRMVTPEAFDRDPLRALRLARLATTLGFAPDPATTAAARQRARRVADVSPERVFAELRLLIGHDDAVRGLGLLDELALTAVVLPELDALRGVDQSVYHHRDVHGHTLEVLQAAIDLERDPGAALGAGRAEAVRTFLAEPLADTLTRAGALRWAALLHDTAKPQTRVELPDGRVGFPGHDRAGAELVRAVLGRLRTSERLRAYVAALTAHHLRLGFLVHEEPLDRRAVYRYLAATQPVAADVTLLSVADRYATRGRNADQAIARHVALAGRLFDAALANRAGERREPLLRGDELARALGVEAGPRLGALLGEIEEARYAGEVATREDALALARRSLGRD